VAGVLRDQLGTYDWAFYGAGALAILASLLSLLLFAAKRIKPIAPGIGLAFAEPAKA
jgi:bacteriorhodopsin